MSNENKDIRFEERDTDVRAILNLGFIVLAIIFTIGMSMIPFTRYMWNKTEKNLPSGSQPTVLSSPEVILEVRPGSELGKQHDEITATDANKKIDAAMQKALAQGFPVRKS